MSITILQVQSSLHVQFMIWYFLREWSYRERKSEEQKYKKETKEWERKKRERIKDRESERETGKQYDTKTERKVYLNYCI